MTKFVTLTSLVNKLFTQCVQVKLEHVGTGLVKKIARGVHLGAKYVDET